MEKLKNAATLFLSVNPVRFAIAILVAACLNISTTTEAHAGHPSWQGGSEATDSPATPGNTAPISGNTDKPNYIQIPAMTVPVIGDNGVNQNISLSVVVEATSVAAADDIRKSLPRLSDAYITNLYSLLNGHVAVREGVVQVAIVKKDLETISRKVVGDDKIRDVLLQVVYQKRM